MGSMKTLTVLLLTAVVILSLASVLTEQGAAQTQSFTPVADAFVKQASPAKNFGSRASLRADTSPVVRSYLQFKVQALSGTITKATLRVHGKSKSNGGFEVRSVADNGWAEHTLTYE